MGQSNGHKGVKLVETSGGAVTGAKMVALNRTPHESRVEIGKVGPVGIWADLIHAENVKACPISGAN